MNVLKRATLSLMSTVDKTVSRLEDHDALVSAKIAGINQQIARSKVEIMKVDKEGTRLKEQLTTTQADMASWERRATEVMHNDRDKALACLQRRNQCETQIHALTSQLQQQDNLKQDMQARLVQMQNRLTEIKQQQTQLRNRTSQAEINRIANQVTTSAGDDFSDVFERWEEKVMANELNHEVLPDAADYQDNLETEFLAQEQRASLNAQLEALMQHEGQKHD